MIEIKNEKMRMNENGKSHVKKYEFSYTFTPFLCNILLLLDLCVRL